MSKMFYEALGCNGPRSPSTTRAKTERTTTTTALTSSCAWLWKAFTADPKLAAYLSADARPYDPRKPDPPETVTLAEQAE
jgi:hypothetical protein